MNINTRGGLALAGNRIAVIGGTAGLGLSAVKAFVMAGARVVVVGLKSENVESAQREMGDAAMMMCGDASCSDTAVSAVTKAVSTFGGVDGLYHVAGGSGRRWGDGPLHEISDEGWDATAKSAVVGFTKSCAAFCASRGIRFNVLAPALMETPMAQRAANDETILAFIKTKQPLDGGRIGQPADLDAATVYFMSDASKFTTGQVLAMDGGWCVSEGQNPTKP
jgi:NAD(P)-dependent dehydrogenase (short-subunit alcohol dehydrogenase family)